MTMLDHVGLAVADCQRSKAFYENGSGRSSGEIDELLT